MEHFLGLLGQMIEEEWQYSHDTAYGYVDCVGVYRYAMYWYFSKSFSENDKYLCLKNDSEMVMIPLHEIRYIEVEGNYVTVHADDDYTVRQTLSEMEQEMDDRFFRVSRSFIINLFKIRKVTKSEAILIDNPAIPLPRNAYQALNRAIIERL